MIRDWDFTWNVSEERWDVASNFESSEWTAYDGDLPAYDYVMEFDAPNQEYDPVWQTSYHLGLAQRDADDGQGGPGPTRYFHTDHLGTTRAMSDDGAVGPPPEPVTVSPRLVFTAFGELVASTGPDGLPVPPDTRYGYVGASGYETLGELVQGMSFPYTHVGYRWYDPSSGRFLQRDPIGIQGEENVYVYASNNPMEGMDPTGLKPHSGFTPLSMGAPAVAPFGGNFLDRQQVVPGPRPAPAPTPAKKPRDRTNFEKYGPLALEGAATGTMVYWYWGGLGATVGEVCSLPLAPFRDDIYPGWIYRRFYDTWRDNVWPAIRPF